MQSIQEDTVTLTNILKRQTLKYILSLATVSLPIVVPSVATAKNNLTRNQISRELLPVSLEVTLVSKPNFTGESLLLKNVTNQLMTIAKFNNGKLLFDGSVIDCGDATAENPINLLAGQHKLIRLKSHLKSNTAEQYQPASTSYQNVDSEVFFLSEGTRVVPLVAHFHNSTADIFVRRHYRSPSLNYS